jgi:hypothetical protein
VKHSFDEYTPLALVVADIGVIIRPSLACVGFRIDLTLSTTPFRGLSSSLKVSANWKPIRVDEHKSYDK